MRHGTACALLANVNRNPTARPDAYKPTDFVPWATPAAVDEPPVALDDPVAHSNLMRAALFGIAPKSAD
jgi:hypothetical protein